MTDARYMGSRIDPARRTDNVGLVFLFRHDIVVCTCCLRFHVTKFRVLLFIVRSNRGRFRRSVAPAGHAVRAANARLPLANKSNGSRANDNKQKTSRRRYVIK